MAFKFPDRNVIERMRQAGGRSIGPVDKIWSGPLSTFALEEQRRPIAVDPAVGLVEPQR